MTHRNDTHQIAGRWFVLLLSGSLGLHVVLALVLVLTPWGQRTMGFDTQQHEEDLERLEQLHELREEYERQRRDQVRLDPEQAEKLRKHEEAQKRDLLKENVRRLIQARQRAMEEREKAFDRLLKRTEEELLPHQIERLQEELKRAIHVAHQPTRESKHTGETKRMKRELEQELDRIKDIKKRADKAAEEGRKDKNAAEDLKKAAKDIADKAARLGERYREMSEQSHGSFKHRTKMAGEAMDSLKRESGRHQEGIDLDRLNDTTAQGEVGDLPNAARSEAAIQASEPADLYEAAQELERQVDTATQQADAADLAALQGSSVADAMSKTAQPSPDRPDLGGVLRNPAQARRAEGDAASGGQGGGQESGDDGDGGGSGGEQANNSSGAASGGAQASGGSGGGPGVETVGDLHRFRDAIELATHETTDMARRADRKTSGGSATSLRGLAAASPADLARHEAMDHASRTSGQRNRHQLVDMTGFQMGSWDGGGLGAGGDVGLISGGAGGGEMARGVGRQSEYRLREEVVTANALPGRMLTDDSSRQGFLYLDTWYVIGPWDNWSRADFEIVHPPEKRVDLDAEYFDGKFADRPEHPDHVLRWHFVQSDRMAIQPPRPMFSATFYAYTEIYSDKTREMLIAVASDDMAKVWLNGDVIWTDVGQSGWNLDEGFRKVVFKKGFNEMLVRFENGPAFVAFSVVLCPPEALNAE